MGLSPIGGAVGKIISNIFGDPGVLVRRKDGGVEQIPLSELKKRGIDPNNDGDDWLEKVKDFFRNLWSQLNNGGGLA